jgi:uncharacterized protein YacL
MNLANLSNFQNTRDYLPIITGALITDMIALVLILAGYISGKSIKEWYVTYGLSGVLVDTLSITIGVILARLFYPLFFTKYSLLLFLVLTCAVQLIHDLLFYLFFKTVPRNKSPIMDIFNDYAREYGYLILMVDSMMMISTVLIGSYLATLNTNSIIITLIVSLYVLPYLLHSIKK